MNIVNVYIPESMFAYQHWGFHDGLQHVPLVAVAVQSLVQSLCSAAHGAESEVLRSHLVTGGCFQQATRSPL